MNLRAGTIAAASHFIIGIRKDGSEVRFGEGRDAETAILDANAETVGLKLHSRDIYRALEVRDASGKVLAAWDGPEFQFRSNLDIDDLRFDE